MSDDLDCASGEAARYLRLLLLVRKQGKKCVLSEWLEESVREVYMCR